MDDKELVMKIITTATDQIESAINAKETEQRDIEAFFEQKRANSPVQKRINAIRASIQRTAQ